MDLNERSGIKQWQLIAGGFSHVNCIQIWTWTCHECYTISLCVHMTSVVSSCHVTVMWWSCDDSCMCIGACGVIWWDDEGPCVTSWCLLPLTECCVQCRGGKNWGNIYTYTYVLCECLYMCVVCMRVCMYIYVCVHVYIVMLEYTSCCSN